jgi:hypothetical protein
MMAAAAIQEGQVLLQVPDLLFMTANTAVKSKLCGKLVKAAELPEWQVRSWWCRASWSPNTRNC